MPSHTDPLRWTHLTPETTREWAGLVAVLAEVDGTGEYFDAEDLAEELTEAGVTPSTDTWAVWDGPSLVAYGQVRVALALDSESRVRCHVSGGVHPGWRGRGIGAELLTAMESRARALASERHPGVEAYLRGQGGVEGSGARRLLTRRGYAVVRYFNDLSRPLPGPVLPDGAELPEGVRLVSQSKEYAEATRLAHNAAFADHWGSVELTSQEWLDHWHSRTSRPEVSSLAVDAEGHVLAYVIAAQYVPRTVYIDIVGTVREARGRGLAVACLTRTLALAAESGDYDLAELGVDSTSPTGATRLYEHLGFSAVRTMAAMQRD